jgi:hypothetical protein
MSLKIGIRFGIAQTFILNFVTQYIRFVSKSLIKENNKRSLIYKQGLNDWFNLEI